MDNTNERRAVFWLINISRWIIQCETWCLKGFGNLVSTVLEIECPNMIMVKRNRRERDEMAERAVGMAKVPGPEKLDVKDIKKLW